MAVPLRHDSHATGRRRPARLRGRSDRRERSPPVAGAGNFGFRRHAVRTDIVDTTPILILPGYGDSGPDHWQSHWERADPGCRRVVQDDWLQPRLDDWLATLGRHLRECATPPVLVAHSLSCSLVAHWAMRTRADVEGRPGFAGASRAPGGLGGPLEAPHVQIKGVLLVAPADVDSPDHTPDEVRGFSPMPLARLPFPSIVVASEDDPFVSPERAAAFARAWGSRLVTLERAGHINADAGFGPWPEGRRLLADLMD